MYSPIRVFILDLVNIYEVLNINSFSKKFTMVLIGGFIRLILFSFMHFFTNSLVINFEMVLLIANIANFSVCRTFAFGMWTIKKSTLFYKAFFVLVVSLMTRLTEFPLKILSMSMVDGIWEFRVHAYVFPLQHGLY